MLRDLHRWYVTIDSETYVRYLRRKGVEIGESVKFYSPRSNVVDLTRPYLISIGNHVKITRGVLLLTHGFEWCVLREVYKRPFGSAGRIEIGNNVYLGMNTVILKGVRVGNNVIVGAGSVVTRDVPDNAVVAGNPAKLICSLSAYHEKALSRELDEACCEYRALWERLGRLPRPNDFREFFYLYLQRDERAFGKLPVRRQVGGHMSEFLASRPRFKTFEDFAKWCQEHGQRSYSGPENDG